MGKEKVVLTEKEKAALIKQLGALPFANDAMNKLFLKDLPKDKEEKVGK